MFGRLARQAVKQIGSANQLFKAPHPELGQPLAGLCCDEGEEIHHALNVPDKVSLAQLGILGSNTGMESNPISVNLTGTAGQSFGVWNAGGLHMYLRGDCNDYVGKGMAGGKLVIAPPEGSRFESRETSIIGNTCLYGATGGSLFAAGVAGERFAVRNSGAHAVIEGAGDHCCEYMTGGLITVLGATGVNFGAGMTGGLAFVLDEDRAFIDRYNSELVEIHRVAAESMEAHRHFLRDNIREFVNETGSEWGTHLLDNFEDYVGKFWLVKPKAADINQLLSRLRDTD